MKINSILDICLSLIVVYALFSILVSILNECLSQFYDRRSKLLREAINRIMDDKLNINYAALFFNHFSIQTITRYRYSAGSQVLALFGAKVHPKEKGPQYISSQTFAVVLIDLIIQQQGHQKIGIVEMDAQGFAKLDASGKKIYTLGTAEGSEGLVAHFAKSVAALQPSPFSDLLASFISRAKNDPEKLKNLIADWFDTYMNQVSGWYKQKQRAKLLLLGFIVAIGLNIDSVYLIKVISMDDALRENLVATAVQIEKDTRATNDSIRQSTAAQIRFFQIADSILGSSATVSKDVFQAKGRADSGLPEPMKHLEKIVVHADSSFKKYRSQIEEVLGIAADLSLPVGWSPTTAPLSWTSDTTVHLKQKRFNGSGRLAYEQRRNKGQDPWVYLYYFLGIVITAVSLSFGAPFWFDLLTKFVNIRHAASKPLEVKQTKTN